VKLRQEDHNFEDSLSYRAQPSYIVYVKLIVLAHTKMISLKSIGKAKGKIMIRLEKITNLQTRFLPNTDEPEFIKCKHVEH
jgi:hypothetical protein